MNDFHLAMNRPDDVPVNTAFTDEVMSKIAHAEINTKVLRTTNVKNDKETFIMKIRKLPAFASILLAIGFALAISASTYAVYELFFKPNIEQTSIGTTSTGRKELVYDISACSETKGSNTYEVKRNSGLSTAEVKEVIEANCELKLVEDWFTTVTPKKYSWEYIQQDTSAHKKGEMHTSYSIGPVMAQKIASVDGSEIKISSPEKYMLQTNEKTKYVVNGKIMDSPEQLMPNDAIAYLELQDFTGKLAADCVGIECSIDGYPARQHITYIVKLSKAYESYYKGLNALIEILPCSGNEDSECREGNIGGITLTDNPGVYVTGKFDEYKSIEGKVVDVQTDRLSIRASSGKIYTVISNYDVLGDFNINRLQDYAVKPLGLGDTLAVTYYQDHGADSLVIRSSEIATITVLLEMLSKGDPMNKF